MSVCERFDCVQLSDLCGLDAGAATCTRKRCRHLNRTRAQLSRRVQSKRSEDVGQPGGCYIKRGLLHSHMKCCGARGGHLAVGIGATALGDTQGAAAVHA